MQFLGLDGSMGAGPFTFLIGALAIALGFEFVNGFHDTANAVATVIYTRSLSPRWAVIWSGMCNFAGVSLGGTAVAFGIVNLLPVDLLVSVGRGSGMAMVFAILIAAIAWNLGTWLLGLPSSSSHTLIGAILGIGIVHSIRDGIPLSKGVNWHAAGSVGLSLLISPLLGFGCSAALLKLSRMLFREPTLYEPASPDKPPPGWIRAILITTCTGVSFAHGSNDGQKGVGIIMLILIGIVPARYLLDASASPAEIRRVVAAAEEVGDFLGKKPPPKDILDFSPERSKQDLATIRTLLEDRDSPEEITMKQRNKVRSAILRVGEGLKNWEEREKNGLSKSELRWMKSRREQLMKLVEYAPEWVLMSVATALGLGTTVGWKRIVETVGEKIGKSHLSYAQGACAEIVAMATIGLADAAGLPVSTTHVLSSGVAGTMAANGSGIQIKTMRNILLAWVLTLPVSMTLAGTLYLVFQAFSR